MVAEQNLRLQSLVWWLTVVAVFFALIFAYEPATRLWPKMQVFVEAAFAAAGAHERAGNARPGSAAELAFQPLARLTL